MEPVTHVLTGAVLARAGLNRKAAYTAAAMAVAAEFPDIDTVWSWRGPVDGFQHHRGITHTFAGLPFEALVIIAGFWLWHGWRIRQHSGTAARLEGKDQAYALQPAPVRWLRLYMCVLLGLLSHIGLDWTNNYGVRPFFPFNPRWHAGSLLFIFDPLLFVLLVGALLLPGLFRLVGSEVGAKAAVFPPKRWALGALFAALTLIGWRSLEHSRAVDLAAQQMPNAAAELGSEGYGNSEPLLPRTVLANPDPLSPYRWHAVADFGSFLQLEEVDTRRGLVSLDGDRLDKPAPSPALQSALESRLGRVYMDWSPMPAINVSPGTGGASGDAANTVVILQDPRFMGAVPLLHRKGLPPITGTVELNPQNHVVAEAMDGKEQR